VEDEGMSQQPHDQESKPEPEPGPLRAEELLGLALPALPAMRRWQ
jgi:hypothetical protein